MKNNKDFALFFNNTMTMLSFEEKPPGIVNVDEKWESLKTDLLDSTSKKSYKYIEYHNFDTNNTQKRPLYNRILKYAAILLFSTGLPYLSYNTYTSYFAHQTEEYRTIEVPYGERMSITLSDGTDVILDAGSELKVSTNFEKERIVHLKGEAYFKVSHDTKHPFKVFTNNALVRVLGTEFNLRAWDESPNVTITLRRGEVAFSSTKYKSSPTVILTQGKQSTISKNGIPSIPVTVNVDDYTSWHNNELYFKKAPLKEVLAQIERWYNYHFFVDDTLLYSNHLTYHIKETNLQNVLQSISIITNTNIVKDGNEIHFISNVN